MNSSEIEDLRAGRFARDCPAMTLGNGDPDQPRQFSGPGRLSLDELGHLQVVLYDPTHDPDPRHLLRTSGVGEWVSESDVYALEATDLSGRVWRAENLTIGVDVHVARPGAVVRASLESLSSEWDWDHGGNGWMSLFFPHQVKAPRNVRTVTTVEETDVNQTRRGFELNVWAIKCRDFDVRIRFGDQGFEVSVSMKSAELPQDLGASIEEAIWFTLGQPLRADIVRFRQNDAEGVVIHSRGRDEALASPMPPYHISILDSAAVLGAIFCDYYSHVSGNRDGRYHPLSVLVRKALRAEAGTLEEAALARCVAIEGIVGLNFSDLGGASDETLDAVAAIERILADHLESSPIRSRVEGFFGSVKGSSSRTALHALAQRGVITDEQLTAWETLRHVAAHGGEYDIPPREVFELSQRLRTLMMKLIFETIGYQGAYTDYGSQNWPTRRRGRTPEIASPDPPTPA